MAYQLEGDGLLENIYYYIWLKSKQDEGYRGFFLPDTVIYKYQHPRHWFFTSMEGKIKKKTKEKLSVPIIEGEFLKHGSQSGIVATFTYLSDSNRVVEFLGKEELKHFLHYRKKAQDGILQKYIDPKGKHEAMVQMVWTPNICLFEHRENKKNLYDVRYDMYERAATFEGEEFHSHVTQLKAPILKNWLKRVSGQLISHISEVSNKKIRVNRMVLQFKMDADENLWFIRAISIRTKGSSVPVSLEAPSKLPGTVNSKKLSLNPQYPASIQRTVLCRNCDSATEPDCMCEVPYKMIVGSCDSGIPRLIQKIHTHLTQEEYDKYKVNPLFLNKETLICSSCFLKYSKAWHYTNRTSTAPISLSVRALDPQKLIKRREVTLSNRVRSQINTRDTSRPFTAAAGGEFTLPKKNPWSPTNLTNPLVTKRNTINVDLLLKDRKARKLRKYVR